MFGIEVVEDKLHPNGYIDATAVCVCVFIHFVSEKLVFNSLIVLMQTRTFSTYERNNEYVQDNSWEVKGLGS